MRAPFQKASAPRIRALGAEPRRTRSAPPPAPPSGGVFRDFVATLERLEKVRGRKAKAPDAGR
ncbi:hypothetical protein [Aquabacter cavernae]|uniref:hypothetical protein n=1 Tax=Aquabacter cavernae TaxID=2496029 RepID=UPI000F8EA2BE|nr:hypothetical protein [Aquabacter cavernae]